MSFSQWTGNRRELVKKGRKPRKMRRKEHVGEEDTGTGLTGALRALPSTMSDPVASRQVRTGQEKEPPAA